MPCATRTPDMGNHSPDDDEFPDPSLQGDDPDDVMQGLGAATAAYKAGTGCAFITFDGSKRPTAEGQAVRDAARGGTKPAQHPSNNKPCKIAAAALLAKDLWPVVIRPR